MNLFKLNFYILLFCFSTISIAQLRIKAVGDVMMGSRTPNKIVPPQNGKVFIDSTAKLLSDADITFGNLEGVFVNENVKPQKCSAASRNAGRCYEFGMSDTLAYTLKELHFTVMSGDNNHASDYGSQGVVHTQKTLDKHKILYASKKKPISIKKGDVSIAVAAFGHSGVSWHVGNVENVKKIITDLDKKYDLVMVSFHGGAEGTSAQHTPNKVETYYGENRGNVIAFAHTAIDAGADLIIGHGPHVLRGIELYKSKLICYSLGNFLTYGNINIRGVKGASVVMDIILDEKTGDFKTGNIIPVRQIGRGIPSYDPTFEAVKLIKGLTKIDFPSSPLIITDKGELQTQQK